MIKFSAHHMSFPVEDLDVSTKFYQEVLGLDVKPRPNIYGIPGMWFIAGGCEVHLIQVPTGVDVGTTPKMANPGARHAGFQVENYQAAVDHIKAKGLDIYETNPQVGQAWFQDPDGHVIELIEVSE